MDVIWTKKAKEDYWQNIDFLIKEWNNTVAIDFIDIVNDAIIRLSNSPSIGLKTEYNNVRKYIIISQISLYYIYNKSTITLVRFWNNFQNPSSFHLD